MVATCVLLTLVHKRHRFGHCREVEDYYYEQIRLAYPRILHHSVSSIPSACVVQSLLYTLLLRIGSLEMNLSHTSLRVVVDALYVVLMNLLCLSHCDTSINDAVIEWGSESSTDICKARPCSVMPLLCL
jgi:hypothetical protein